MIPHVSVSTVSGSPRRMYSRKPMCTSGLARSTTMIFATEPVIVRFPASVLDMARVSQPTCGSGKPGTSDFSNTTAGTLLTIFDSSAVRHEKIQMRCRFHVTNGCSSISVSPARSAPPHDDEESDEKHQQTPVHLVVDEAWLDGPRDQESRGAE